MINNNLMCQAVKFLDKLDSIIEENMGDEHFCVDNLSNLLYLSNSQVYRKVKQKTGLSPSNYIQKKRLEQAVILIQETDLSISQIAYQLGFNTASYFSRCFSEVFGYPPSELRKQ